MPRSYDFFLVSQSVTQGTVSPTHYNVLVDDWKAPPDVIQKLSYVLTHLYYNWQVSECSLKTILGVPELNLEHENGPFFGCFTLPSVWLQNGLVSIVNAPTVSV